MVPDSGFKVLGSNLSGSKFLIANGGFSIKCLYVTVGGGHRGGGWVGGWLSPGRGPN